MKNQGGYNRFFILPSSSNGMEEDEGGAWQRLNNTPAFEWSARIFLYGYFFAPLALVAAFVLYSSSQPYFSLEAPDLLYMVAILPLALVIGYFLTLYRTPRWILAKPGHALRWLAAGRPIVHVRLEEASYYRVLESFPPRLLLREPCELAEIHAQPTARPIRIVVAEGILDGVLPRRDRRISRAGPPARLRPSAGEDLENDS